MLARLYFLPSSPSSSPGLQAKPRAAKSSSGQALLVIALNSSASMAITASLPGTVDIARHIRYGRHG